MKRHGQVLAFVLAAVAVVALLGGLTACGNAAGGGTSSSPAATTTSSGTGPAAMLPAAIKSSGVLRVGTTFDFPPMESYAADGKTPVGLDVELMQGIANALGLKLQWTNMNWDGLRPAMQSGRFDTIAASMGDFTDRQKQVTFVDYMNINEAVLVKKANVASITKVEDLSGKSISGARGTVAVTGSEQLNKKLVAEGLAPMKLSVFPTDREGVLALQSGRVFGHVMDTPVAVYNAKTAGNGNVFGVVLAGVIPGFPYGIATPKDGALAKAIQAALQQMINDGSYGAIMSQYGVQSTMVKSAVINGGTSSSGA
jgi:polar amino acid transport system substrate-binding protein